MFNGFGFTHSAFGRLSGAAIFFVAFAVGILVLQKSDVPEKSLPTENSQESAHLIQKTIRVELISTTEVDEWQVLLNQIPLTVFTSSSTEFSGEFNRDLPADSELIIGVRPKNLFAETDSALRIQVTLGDQKTERTIWKSGEFTETILLGEFLSGS